MTKQHVNRQRMELQRVFAVTGSPLLAPVFSAKPAFAELASAELKAYPIHTSSGRLPGHNCAKVAN